MILLQYPYISAFYEGQLLKYSEDGILSEEYKLSPTLTTTEICKVLGRISKGNLSEESIQRLPFFYEALKSCNVMDEQFKCGYKLRKNVVRLIGSSEKDQVQLFVKHFPHLVTNKDQSPKEQMEIFCQYNLQDEALALYQSGVGLSPTAFKNALEQNMDDFVLAIIQGWEKFEANSCSAFNRDLFEYLLLAFTHDKPGIAKAILAVDPNPFCNQQAKTICKMANEGPTWIPKEYFSRNFMPLMPKGFVMINTQPETNVLRPAYEEWCAENNLTLQIEDNQFPSYSFFTSSDPLVAINISAKR